MGEEPGALKRIRLDGVRALVVDDCSIIRELVVDILEECGAQVTAAASANEALEILERERPDVLVSDISMPGGDGFALIRKVRALPPERGGQTPAAAFTGLTTAEDRARILGAGFQFHIPKPVDAYSLAGVVAILAIKA